MLDYDTLLTYAPFSLGREEKTSLLMKRLRSLTAYHFQNCKEYRHIVQKVYCKTIDEVEELADLSELPYLPIQLFKKLELCSVPKDAVFKTITSSGTTGQQVSRIFLDRQTAGYQQKTLARIVSDFTGKARMPMIILDCPSVIKNRLMFSARGAGILGFSIFGTKKIYALDDTMKLNMDALKDFVEQNKGQPIFMFGFTYMIWQYVYKELKKSGQCIDLSDAVLIHGGGWKKLQDQAVSRDEFKNRLSDACGIRKENIHDYYGMAEQTGCISMECEYGHLHTSAYSDILVRRSRDFSLCDEGESGMLQVISPIPESYPGHSILTEDMGRILGEDDCPCGRKGKYFEVLGRIAHAEVRGCSDTFEGGTV